jgi:hypothetical protein
MSNRFERTIKYFTDMKAELKVAGIFLSDEAIANLVAADMLRSLRTTIANKGI